MKFPKSLSSEEFRLIPDWDMYCVSNLGRVFMRKLHGKSINGWLPVKVSISNQGYPQVTLTEEGRVKNYKVAVLVLLTFVSSKPSDNHCCCHNDGNPTNSRLDNLRWDTFSGNSLDRAVHGTIAAYSGEANGLSKLTDENVRKIRFLRGIGLSEAEVAARFGVSRKTINNVINKVCWKHVK